VAAIVVFAIPALTVLAVPWQMWDYLFSWFELPELKETLGFTVGRVTMTAQGVTGSHYLIKSVVPGKPFWQAGVRAGDEPMGYEHGSVGPFLWALSEARRKGSAQVWLVPASAVRLREVGAARVFLIKYPRNAVGRRAA
jgi:hypothetical protein